MNDRRPCVRCHREIDRWARSCVYCNWDQAAMPPEKGDSSQASAPAYVPPSEEGRRALFLGIGALVALLFAALTVGALVHRLNEGTTKANGSKSIAAVQANRVLAPARNDIEVVPATGSAGPIEAEQPITSAPATTTAAGVPNE